MSAHLADLYEAGYFDINSFDFKKWVAEQEEIWEVSMMSVVGEMTGAESILLHEKESCNFTNEEGEHEMGWAWTNQLVNPETCKLRSKDSPCSREGWVGA